MKNRDIIVLGLQSWDSEIGSNCINIAQVFSNNNRVLYVNRAIDRISMLRDPKEPKNARRIKSLKKQIPEVVKENDNIWVMDPRVVMESVNWLPRGLFGYFNRLNNKRLGKAILRVCNEIGFKEPILFVDNDFFRAQDLKEVIQPSVFIYYIRDYLHHQPYFRKHGPAMEKGIIKKADLVVANSQYLADYAKKNNKHAYDIGQGCDFTFFNPERSVSTPVDMKDVDRPVIGYVGALVGYRLDIELLYNLALRRKEWTWVLVGPEDEAFLSSRLHELGNVLFLGRKNENELAEYVASFDVCINPQLVNETTIGNYPRKVDEYLAMGKPVVATLTDFMKQFSEYVYLCTGADEYEDAIEKALADGNDVQLIKSRQEFALSHTWENSVEKIYSYVEKPASHE